MHAIIEGVRPEKPENAEAIGLSDTLWELVQACWSEGRTQRPRVRVIVDVVRDAAARWNTLMPPSGLHDGEGPSPTQSDEAPGESNGIMVSCFCLLIGQQLFRSDLSSWSDRGNS